MVKQRQHIKLFYFEIFVDNITFYASERDWVDTILTVSYVENHELVVKESKLTSSHVYGKNEDTVIFQGGRSCVFCIEPKLLNNQCSLELIVSRKNKSGDVIQIGSAKVSLGGTYGDLLSGEDDEKVKKIVQDTRLLKDKKDKPVGSITFAAQLFFYSRVKTGKSEEKLNFLKFQSAEEGDVNSVGDSNPNYVMYNPPKKTETFEPYVEESDESLALSVMESAINGLSQSKSNDFNFPQIFPDQLVEIESSFAKGDSFNDERTFQQNEKQYPLKEKKPTVLLSSGNRNYYDDYRNEDYTGNFKSPFIFNPKAAMKDPYENIPLILENHPTADSRKAYYDNKTRDRSSLSLGYYHGKKRTTYQEDYSLQGNPAHIQTSQKSGLSRPKYNFTNNSPMGRNMTGRPDIKNAQPRPYLSPVTLPSVNAYTVNTNAKPNIKLNEYQPKTNTSAQDVQRSYVPYMENGKATKKHQDASTNTNTTYYPPFSPGYPQTKSTNTNQNMATNTYHYGTYPQYTAHKHKTAQNTPNYQYSPVTETSHTHVTYPQKPNTNMYPYSPLYIPKQHAEIEPQLNSTRQMQYQNYTPKIPPAYTGRQYERNMNTPRYITPQEAYSNPYTYGHYANWSPPAPIATKYEYPTQSPPYYYYRANGLDPQAPKFNAPYRV